MCLYIYTVLYNNSTRNNTLPKGTQLHRNIKETSFESSRDAWLQKPFISEDNNPLQQGSRTRTPGPARGPRPPALQRGGGSVWGPL